MHKISFNEIMSYLKNTHTDFRNFIKRVKFDGGSGYHISIISLYGSILELVESCIILIENNITIAIPIMIRSILEGYVDLINIIKNPKYGYHLRVSHLKTSCKLLNEAKSGNKYLKNMLNNISNIDSLIKNCMKEKEKLKNEGYTEIKIKEKFKQAGMENEYNSIYNILCADSHNGLIALTKRHLSQDASDNSVIFSKNPNQNEITDYALMLLEYLVLSTLLVHDKLNSPVLNNIQSYFEELKKYSDQTKS